MYPIVATLLLVALIIGPLFIVIIGWGQTQAREHVVVALAELKKRNFGLARRLILLAARLDRRTINSPDIKTLYDLVLQGREIPGEELDRYTKIVNNWPQSRAEIIWGHPLTKTAFFGIITLGALIKLLPLLGE